MTPLRVVAILACAAYAAAYHCATCVEQLDDYDLNPAICYTNRHAFMTHCEYGAPYDAQTVVATGELDGGDLGSGDLPLCPAKVAINDKDNCSPCKDD